MIKGKKMLIGITGGIGSGKTTVAKIFNILGIPVYSADDRAKWLMANDSDLKSQIISYFGRESYFEDGSLNRSYLASSVFNDEKKVSLINSLVHPAVKKDFEQWVLEQDSPYVMKEAALLFESGSYKDLDKVINVSAPLKIRINRVILRDPQRSENQINDIINKQMPDEEKNLKADYVIKNSDNRLLIPQVMQIHHELLNSDK